MTICISGSFTSLNNSLNSFTSTTTVAAPPDAWAYSSAYDLAPHLNLLSPSNSPYSATFGGPSNNGSAYSYATMLSQHDASLFSSPSGNTMRVHQDYINTNNSPSPTLSRGDYQVKKMQKLKNVFFFKRLKIPNTKKLFGNLWE